MNFGEILNTSIDQGMGEVPILDFTLDELVLLGDPTLNLPYDLKYEYLPGDANMGNGAWPPSVTGSDITYMVNYFKSYA